MNKIVNVLSKLLRNSDTQPPTSWPLTTDGIKNTVIARTASSWGIAHLAVVKTPQTEATTSSQKTTTRNTQAPRTPDGQTNFDQDNQRRHEAGRGRNGFAG